MSRLRTLALSVILTLTSCGFAHADDPDRQRLVTLFNKVQDVLLTINAEVIQYGERFADVSQRLRDREVWESDEIDQARLVPTLRELNRLKMALGLIGTGLESKYAQVRTFQPELRERYPSYQADIDHYYVMFDKVYENTRERHRKLTRQMDDLKVWFKQRVAAHQAAHGEDESLAEARPRRRNRRTQLANARD